MSVEKLKIKIAKLLEMANSTTHPAEAESFAAKARALMEEHQLSMGEVFAEQDPLGETHDEIKYAQREYRMLAAAACKYFGCALVYIRGTKHITIFGRESNRTMAQVMIPYWVKECNRRGSELYKTTHVYRDRKQAIHRVMDAFTERLHDLADKDPAKAGHSSLPVPVDEANAMIPSDTKELVSRTRFSRAARTAASEISLASQVTRSSQKSIA